MEVYLRKDVEKIGLAGEIIKVGDGYARNFLIPRGFAVEITEHNRDQYLAKIRKVENRKEVLASQISMLAENVANITITLKKKMHDNGQLYGAVNASEVVEALAEKGVSITKNQVEFENPIKSKGTYKVTIKFATNLKPAISLHIVAE